MASRFGMEVSAFRRKALNNIDRAHKEATAELIVLANTPKTQGGNTPIDTGYMIASIFGGSATGLPVQGTTNLIAALQIAEPFQEFQFAWEAFYSVFVEFGTSKQAPQPFVRPAVEQWPSIIASVAQRINV